MILRHILKIRGPQIFSKFWEPTPKGDRKQVPYWEPTNVRCCTKFSLPGCLAPGICASLLKMVNPTKQDQRDIQRPVLLHFKSNDGTVKHFRMVVSRSRVNAWVNSPRVSCYHMTIPIIMWPTGCRTNWMPWDRRCSDILHVAWTCWYAILTSLDC
jgi:hypothetical protein